MSTDLRERFQAAVPEPDLPLDVSVLYRRGQRRRRMRQVAVIAAAAVVVAIGAIVGTSLLNEQTAPYIDEQPTAQTDAHPTRDDTTHAASPQAANPACLDDEPGQSGHGTVLVYFGCGYGADPLVARTRPTPEGDLLQRLAYVVSEFVAGPSSEERDRGYRDVVPGDPSLLSGVGYLEESQTAVVTFDSAILDLNNLGTAGVTLPFVDGLRATVFQFDDVATLRLQVDNECWNIDPIGRCTFQNDN